MTQNEIIAIVHKCACTYDTNLCNTQVMFVYYNAQNKVEFAEVRFRAHNFLHFTGLVPRQGISANTFYHKIVNNKLSPNDFFVKCPFTTELKLKILSSIVNIDQTARMIGNYTGPHLELYTEKVAGTTSACLGLKKKNDFFIPNTVLSEDIRNISQYPPGKIFAIFKMKSTKRKYTQLTYKKKDLQLTKSLFPATVLSKIDSQLFSS